MAGKILIAAILAGIAAGVFATAMQSWRVIPLIIEAERYENGTASGIAQNHGAALQNDTDAANLGSFHASGIDAERTFHTLLANGVIGVGFSLLLTAAILLLNRPITASSGLIWGIAGFVVFVLAPSVCLPPELPGMPAGDLVQRQIWWLVTVLCTAAGLYLLAFHRKLPLMLMAVALIVTPHVPGGPRPITMESGVPAGLAAEYVVATFVASVLFWLFLGGLVGYLFRRIAGHETASA